MFTSDRGGCCLQPCTLLVTRTGTHRLRVAVMTTNLMHGWTHTCCGLARSPRHSDATHLVHYAARESQSPAPDGRLLPVRSRHRRRRPPQPAGQRYRAAVALLLLICPCRAILTCFARNTVAPRHRDLLCPQHHRARGAGLSNGTVTARSTRRPNGTALTLLSRDACCPGQPCRATITLPVASPHGWPILLRRITLCSSTCLYA